MTRPQAPDLIAIDHDDYHAEHVGRTADGRQFFLTTPFVPGGDEYVALYVFHARGGLVEARIESFGRRADLDAAARRHAYLTRLAELGPVTLDRIEVAPFTVEHDGERFGLVLRWGSDDDDHGPDDEDFVVAEVLPGNYMAFFEPWDSGEYDT